MTLPNVPVAEGVGEAVIAGAETVEGAGLAGAAVEGVPEVPVAEAVDCSGVSAAAIKEFAGVDNAGAGLAHARRLAALAVR